MDLDYWWLLLIPGIFGLGWMAARFDVKHLLSESANLPRSYFKGLNFLLNEQPDKAIDAFIEVVKPLNYILRWVICFAGAVKQSARFGCTRTC